MSHLLQFVALQKRVHVQLELDRISLGVKRSYYWDLVGNLETIEAKKKAVDLSEKLLRDNQARLEAGLLNSTEVRVTETQLMRNRQNLLSSRLDALRIEDQVRAALNLSSLPVGLY